MELAEFFNQVPDPRRPQGQRFPLPALLWMTFQAMAPGSVGPRKMAQFCRSNAPFFTAYFGLRHGVPSYGAFRDLLQALDKNALARAFGRWFGPQAQAAGAGGRRRPATGWLATGKACARPCGAPTRPAKASLRW